MVLVRKTRNSGKSIIVNLPSQIIEAYDINNGDLVEFKPMKNGEIKLKKISI